MRQREAGTAWVRGDAQPSLMSSGDRACCCAIEAIRRRAMGRNLSLPRPVSEAARAWHSGDRGEQRRVNTRLANLRHPKYGVHDGLGELAARSAGREAGE